METTRIYITKSEYESLMAEAGAAATAAERDEVVARRLGEGCRFEAGYNEFFKDDRLVEFTICADPIRVEMTPERHAQFVAEFEASFKPAEANAGGVQTDAVCSRWFGAGASFDPGSNGISVGSRWVDVVVTN